jgi:twinkle protein
VGEFVQHEPCPSCQSSDGLARYDDNSAHCFVCKHNINIGGDIVEVDDTPAHGGDWTPIHGEVRELMHIGLREETLQKWRAKVGKKNGHPVHIYEQRDDNGKLVAQKFRDKDKNFTWIGNSKNPHLYGKWLWPKGGKYLTITEGEKDAHTMTQVFGVDKAYAVTSLPNGTGSVAQVIKLDYDYICSFGTVVLMFDMDEAGRQATEIACAMLPPDKVKIAKLPHKDANDVLMADGPGVLVKCFWDAERFTPAGIVAGTSFTREMLKKAVKPGFELPYPILQEKIMGIRKGEITMLTAGSGIGKSSWAREIAYLVNQNHNCKIGNIYLEETNAQTAQAYVALHNNVPLRKIMFNANALSDEQWDRGILEVVHKGGSLTTSAPSQATN